MSEIELIATTAFGLESVVSRELQQLGYHHQCVEDGRVRFKGDLNAICRSNLWLRSADRVLVLLSEFPAEDFDQLFTGMSEIPWTDWLPPDAAFPVDGRSVRSRLENVPSVQSVSKRAIVDAMRRMTGRHWLPETGVKYPIEVSILNDWATVTLDTSGDGLHKRGYRAKVGPAPLRETMAAGLILLSFWNRNRPFLDPFCGSGTLPIEAALIARNRAPGINRNFQAEDWQRLPRELWKQARQEAKDLELPRPSQVIYASDISEPAIKLSRQHARDANVEPDINFLVRDVHEITLPAEYGVVVTNPPYGERMGERSQAEDVYRAIRGLAECHPTWSYYVLTTHLGFERFFERPADRRRKLYNGRLECCLFQYFGPRPPQVASDVDGGTNADGRRELPPVVRYEGRAVVARRQIAEERTQANVDITQSPRFLWVAPKTQDPPPTGDGPG